jgi:hypothetical protein
MRRILPLPARSASKGVSCWRCGLVILLTVVAAAPAQVPSETEPIKLTLSPAVAPSPALKYVLLPELKDQTPGNAALEYYRAFSPEWWGHIRQPKTWESITNALQMPLTDLPRKEIGWLEGNHMLRQVDNAARREYIDWGMAERLRREGFGLLVPDIQSLRQIGTLLAVRARLEIAEGRYDRAVYTLQTGMALARHVGEGVILIQDLVGMAIAQQMLAQLEELIQQPAAPNLYWALTELPRPLFDLRKALQGEKLGLYAAIPELRSLETTPLTAEQQQRLLRILGGGLDELLSGRPKPNWSNRLMGTALVLRAYPEAKQALIAAGRKPEEVEGLPALQVVLIHSWHQYQRLQDDWFKWCSLPFWEAGPHFEQVNKQLRQARHRLEALPFFEALPAIQKVIATVVRVDRRIAALRCIEAIRLYAAAHDGKLPATLDAITEVPVPIDPMTGKAFTYRASGDQVTLSALPPQGEKANPFNSLHYELTFRHNK